MMKIRGASFTRPVPHYLRHLNLTKLTHFIYYRGDNVVASKPLSSNLCAVDVTGTAGDGGTNCAANNPCDLPAHAWPRQHGWSSKSMCTGSNVNTEEATSSGNTAGKKARVHYAFETEDEWHAKHGQFQQLTAQNTRGFAEFNLKVVRAALSN
ncbi:hypothetical protein BU15DRAFT_63959 [Melanogaster broomeanus]|nr:hypothetical protein BU15DRAFT_63959 [Melanogaster broomeanus]